jgi:predicted metal-dependent phosphoesterase TrpH
MKTADLHVHTTASDGRVSPQNILQQAKQVGLAAIAITDHDTVDGLLSVWKTIKQEGSLEVIPGIEFSTDIPNHEVHILGYYIDPFHQALTEQLELLINSRMERARQIVLKLAKLGYLVDYDRVLQIAGSATAIGRPHIARALVERGYFIRIADVFHNLLKTDGPAYVSHYKMDLQAIIKLIRLIGGVPVLAHPGLIHNDKLVEEVIHCGIGGIEAYHPIHSPEAVSRYLTVAQQHHLLVTGGSDYHAIPGRFPEQLGIYTVPYRLAEQLGQGVL